MTEPDSSRRTRKKQQMQNRIVQTAMDLFNNQGVETTTMEQIADQADIAKATLYKYFPVKEAIIATYWQQVTLEFAQTMEQLLTQHRDTRSRLKALFLKSIAAIMENKDLYKIYISYRMQYMHTPEINEQLRSGNDRLFARIIASGQEAGEIRADIPLAVLVATIELMFFMKSIMWLYKPDTFSAEQVATMIIDLFFNGAKA